MTEQLRRQAFARIALRLKRARDDVGTFIETVVKNTKGVPLELWAGHRLWLAHIDYCWSNGLRSILVAPFGHGKTSCVALPYLAWMIGRDPNIRVKIITKGDGMARERLNLIRQIIESPAYHAVFPGVQKGKRWTDHSLVLQRTGHAVDPTVQARGLDTVGVGGRADVLLFDDVCDLENSREPARRKKVFEDIEQTWLSRIEPNTKVLYVGTPWHVDDALAHLIQRPGWCSLVQAAGEAGSYDHQPVVVGDIGGYPDQAGQELKENAA